MRDPLVLIGVAYVRGAADPAVGFDCWTLVEYVRREFYQLPTPLAGTGRHVAGATIIAEAQASGEWKALTVATPGAVVGLAVAKRLPLHHVGVAVEGGVLHAWNGFGASGAGSVMLTPWARLQHMFRRAEVYEWRG
jgi:cell wall-associated NlpC family hydrolase